MVVAPDEGAAAIVLANCDTLALYGVAVSLVRTALGLETVDDVMRGWDPATTRTSVQPMSGERQPRKGAPHAAECSMKSPAKRR